MTGKEEAKLGTEEEEESIIGWRIGVTEGEDRVMARGRVEKEEGGEGWR